MTHFVIKIKFRNISIVHLTIKINTKYNHFKLKQKVIKQDKIFHVYFPKKKEIVIDKPKNSIKKNKNAHEGLVSKVPP